MDKADKMFIGLIIIISGILLYVLYTEVQEEKECESLNGIYRDGLCFGKDSLIRIHK